MIRFFYFILIFSIAIISPLLVFSTSHTPGLFKGSFLVYNDTVFTYVNGKIIVNKIILIQKVICVFPNGSILLNNTIIAFNESSYFCPSISIQNYSHPNGMFYICPYLLGKNISCNNLIFNGTTPSGLYIYYRCTHFFGAKNELILYFNSSGIAISGVDIQCKCGINESVAYYKLWKTNIITNESLPSFTGFTKARVLTYNLSCDLTREFHDISFTILSLGLSGILIILIFRPQTKLNDK